LCQYRFQQFTGDAIAIGPKKAVGMAYSVPALSAGVLVVGHLIRREVDETPAVAYETDVPKAPVREAFRHGWRDMIRVVYMALMNVIPVMATIFGAAYALQASYGIGFHKSVYLWIPVVANIVAVVLIPFVGSLSDRIGRKVPLAVGAVASGFLSFGYLYAMSIHNVALAFTMPILMWDVAYQGYNAVFPSFYPELFPTRSRVSAMAISQNIGTLITALLPALFATVALPGSNNIPVTIGSITRPEAEKHWSVGFP
jgi:MFS family permease